MKNTVACLLLAMLMIASGCGAGGQDTAPVQSPDTAPSVSAEDFHGSDLLSFCGYEGVDLEELTMTAWFNDCEAGAYETEPALSAADLTAMTVTGKESSLQTTGNTVSYCFTDTEGSVVAVFEFYEDLLVLPDGMYTVEQPQ